MSLNILLNKSAINNLVFIDFITVTNHSTLQEFSINDPLGYKLWLDSYLKNDDKNGLSTEEYYHTKSCFNPLYSRIVGAAIGAFSKEDEKDVIKIKNLYAENETLLLGMISTIFYNAFDKKKILAAHNLSGFHLPFFTKRFISKENAGKIVAKDLDGKQVLASFPAIIGEQLIAKPWEQKTLDTMQVIKFGSFYNTSLEQALYHTNLEKHIPNIGKENASAKYWNSYNEVKNQKPDANPKLKFDNSEMAVLAASYVEGTMKLYQFLRETL